MRLSLLPILTLFAIPACGTVLCELPSSSSLTIRGSEQLNPDADGRSLPTIVRVYQLRDIGSFEIASFEEVWQRPEAVLGDSLLSKDEVTLYPSQVVTRSFDRNPAANFVVAVGIFRRAVGNTWRTVMPLPPTRSQTQCALAQSGDDDGPPPIPQVTLLLEDNHIRGILRLVEPDSNFLDSLPDVSAMQCGPSAATTIL